MEEKNLPEKKFRAGAISSTIWANKAKREGKEVTFMTVSLERSYTDKQGNWQSTTTMRSADIPKAALVLQKAYEYIMLKNNEAEQLA